MKANFILLLLLMTFSLHSQGDPMRYSIEYGLNYSAKFDNIPNIFFPEIASSLFARAELATKKSSRFTGGLGFIQARIIIRDYSGLQPFRDDERHYHQDFMVVPVGMKFNIGSFYIHPEVGAAYNYRFLVKTYKVDSDMEIVDGPDIEDYTPEAFEIKFTPLLALGYEIKVGTLKILTGVKGYIVVQPDFIDVYGIGLIVGVKI